MTAPITHEPAEHFFRGVCICGGPCCVKVVNVSDKTCSCDDCPSAKCGMKIFQIGSRPESRHPSVPKPRKGAKS